MKNVKIYKERMAKTMTMEEKLFFLSHINLHTYDFIIDFFGANGALIHEIQARFPDLKAIFIIVDNSPQMETEYELNNCLRCNSLKQVKEWYGKTSMGEVLLICNSVLHEVDDATVEEILDFTKEHVRTVVMRDMACDFSNTASISYHLESDFRWCPAYSVICRDVDLHDRFLEFLEYCNEWGTTEKQVMAQFILKYEYVENWDTEVKENYFSNNIIKVSDMLSDNGWYSIYKRDYVLPYKNEQAKKVFNWEYMPNTHRQIILERGSR